MNRDYEQMNTRQLEQELKQIDNQISYQKQRYNSYDQTEHKSAERRLGRLCAQRQVVVSLYQKRKQKTQRKYKVDQKMKSLTGYTRPELRKKTIRDYGMTPLKTAVHMATGTIVVGGVVVGIVLGAQCLSWMHSNGIENWNDFQNRIERKDQIEDSKEVYGNAQESKSLQDFFTTKEGRLIDYYSQAYGVDRSLAASAYIHGNPISIGTNITAYNEKDSKYDNIVVPKDDVESQTRAVCAALAEASQLCNANPVVMVAMYEQGYNGKIDFINQGIQITDYEKTLKNPDINTEFVQKVLADCPDVLQNNWYENEHKYTKTINLKSGEEKTDEEVMEISVAYKNR